MKILKKIKGKIESRRFGSLYAESVKELGGVEYATFGFKQKVFNKMNEIRERRKRKVINFIIGLMVAVITGIISSSLFNLIGYYQ